MLINKKVLVLFILLFIISNVNALNLIEGDFEGTLGDWEWYNINDGGSAQLEVVSNTNAPSGNFDLNIDGSGAGQLLIYKIPINSTFDISFHAQCVNNCGAAPELTYRDFNSLPSGDGLNDGDVISSSDLTNIYDIKTSSCADANIGIPDVNYINNPHNPTNCSIGVNENRFFGFNTGASPNNATIRIDKVDFNVTNVDLIDLNHDPEPANTGDSVQITGTISPTSDVNAGIRLVCGESPSTTGLCIGGIVTNRFPSCLFTMPTTDVTALCYVVDANTSQVSGTFTESIINGVRH